MDKKIFKGFKQVTRAQFDSEENKSGYLWFVRTEPEATPSVVDEGEEVKPNDEYDIYFGSKQYGHFCEGELQSIKDRITTLEGNVDEILRVLDEEILVAIDNNANAITANTKSITTLSEELSKHIIKNVDPNDKVLNVADGILSSSIELVYEDTHIKLYGKGKEELGSIDASAFIKDSVLENVEVIEKEDGKYIEFTWKTEGDTTKTDAIKVTDFAKFYSAGNALELTEDDKFNVKVAANDNFLSVNDNNELIVDDVTTDKTMIKEDITIAGGPLASDSVKAAFDGGVIPAGTDIQSVLKALLCVEIYPDTIKSEPVYNVKVITPSISASAGTVSIKSGALVEVGQTITFASLTAGTVSIYGQINPVVSGLEHGYSDAVSGGTVINETTIGTEWDIKQMDGQVYELEASITSGFSEQTDSLPSVVQASASTSCVLDSCTLVADLGTNTYKVSEDAPKFVGSYDAVSEVYVVSNLGGRSEDKKSKSFEASGDVEKDANDDSTSTNSRTFSVVGVYPVYTNGVSASTTDATAANMSDLSAHVSGDGTKLALMKADTAFAVSFAAHIEDVEGYRLYLPGDWKVKTALGINANTAKFAVDQKSKFVALKDEKGEVVKVKRTIQGKEVDYTVYEYLATEGANRVKFTVG